MLLAPPVLSERSSAALIARYLQARGVERVFGLCGGHIMPIWMSLAKVGIAIVDVRDERAAVYMAHAHSEVTGQLGVALITAGPGVTNGMTGIANAHTARAPILILSGLPPQAQENRGALQDVVHTSFVGPLTRYARTVRDPAHVLPEMYEAIARAFGEAGGEPGPVYLDFPVDMLRMEVPEAVELNEFFNVPPRAPVPPDTGRVRAAAEAIWSAKRPLVISGRGARGCGTELVRFLDATGALYLETGETRGLVSEHHPAVVSAVRGAVMGDADLVLTLGRRLDFQLAYGSPAVFGNAKFVRVADVPSELRDNRPGDVAVYGSVGLTLAAMVDAAGAREPAVDREWTKKHRAAHDQRAGKFAKTLSEAPDGGDGRMHPNRLLGALRDALPSDAVVVVDGGDFLSFARVAINATTMLDPGSLGCIGIGTAFGIGAALALPQRPVAVLTGDGSFGFNAMEIDTAVRHNVPILVVVANNGSWAIEVRDQVESYGHVVGTRLRDTDYAMMARGLGMHARRVERADELPAAIAEAMAHRPALLDVVVTPEAVSADGKSGLAWVPDLQPLAAWDDAERAYRGGA
ncbi:MAG: acetolactate synthase [Vulcanimicrobiaceae bacterium]